MSSAVRRLVTALLLGVALYGVAIAYTGFRELEDSLASFTWWTFVLAVVLATLNYFFRYLRWEYYLALLDIRGISKVDSGLVFLSGFVLTITPGKVGEVFKSAVLKQTHDVPIERTAPIVIAERLSDLLGVVTVILLGSIGFPSGFGWALAGGAAVVVGLVLILWKRPAEAMLAFLGRHPKLGKIEPKVRDAVFSLRVLAHPRVILLPLVLSIVAWACEGIALWVILRGFGTSPPILVAVFFYETASLAGALIPVPGGLGVVEAMLREQLVHLGGVPGAAATASMILVRFATLWWAVALGFLALGFLRARHPKLRGAEPASA